MCGIAGIVCADSTRTVDPSALRRMSDAIAHRGPDAAGTFIRGPVGLAHRRLSIIDLAGGSQPIGNEDGSIQVVFNGEIYNFRELRRELECQGHSFRTDSDTEVIVHLYEEHGDECIERLRGMFAIALFDGRRHRVLLARDRVGIKPLYLSLNHERLVFSSELKSVLACGDISRELDPSALDEYLAYGMVPRERCIFRGIEKLPPGHTLAVDLSDWRISRRRYWQLQFQPDESLTPEDWKAALHAKLAETVRAHLIADVPVGAFLSGGIDSSMVTGLASAALPTPIQTFSIGFREARFNELPAAREISGHFGTEHTEQIVTADAAALLPELSRYYDEPFADSSAIPTFLVSRLAASHVKVVLSGDGGDEALGGYSRYAHDLKEASLRRLLPRWMRRPWLAALAAVWPKADRLPRPMRLKTLLTNLSLPDAEAYANTLSLCRLPLRRRLLHPDIRPFTSARDVAQPVTDAWRSSGSTDALSGMIAADMATLLPDDYLVKVDRASMAHGLEVRPPLLDHEFLELCARVPSRWKIHRGETKWLLRETARDLLPASILSRPKQGFEIPVDAWFQGSLRGMFRDTVLARSAPVAGLIDQRIAEQLFVRHLSGAGRHGGMLWSLLSLAAWAESWLKADSSRATQATSTAGVATTLSRDEVPI